MTTIMNKPEVIAALTRGVAEGKTVNEMAIALKVHPNAVRAKLHAMKLVAAPEDTFWTDSALKLLKHMRQRNDSLETIAQVLGTTVAAVRAKAADMRRQIEGTPQKLQKMPNVRFEDHPRADRDKAGRAPMPKASRSLTGNSSEQCIIS